MCKQELNVNFIAVAGFPKNGNTLVNESLNQAGYLLRGDWEAPNYEYQNPQDINRIRNALFSANPCLGSQYCHLKTHIKYSSGSYDLVDIGIRIDKFLVIIRNPFDTLLSATNYLRYSASKNHRLSEPQKSTLRHLYPDYSENDVFDERRFNLELLRGNGSLDQALEIFTASSTCIPQYVKRSGTWLGFYNSFEHAQKQVLRIRFEDIVDSRNNLEEILDKTAAFLSCDLNILARGFKKQKEMCEQSKREGDLFFPMAKSKYFFRYFEGRSLKRFCNKYLTELKAFGYEDLIDEVMSH
jgi:hypothetical protein